MKVYIDIGHGERGDPGAVSGSFVEHQMNIKVAHAFANRMQQNGWEVKTEQGNLEMGDSARAANSWGADMLLSFHMNAGGGDRGEVIYSWESGALELANAVADGLKIAGQSVVRVYKSKANSSGTAEYFGILRVSKMPAVIVEPCFLDNAIDRQIADTDEKLRNIGYCIADAMAEHYGGDEMATETKIKVNGKVLTGYILKDNLSYAPVRALAEALGYKVDWDDQSKTVIITK